MDNSTTCERKFNKFGTCIACQGGDEACHHNALTEVDGKTVCVICGEEING